MPQKRWHGIENFYSGEEDVTSPPKRNFLEKNRTYISAALFLFVFVFLNLAVWQMFRSLHHPFTDMMERTALLYPEAKKTDPAQLIEAMKGKDTDADGLSDYDETYVYSTSPYLEDSDSDGTTDKAEIDKNDNPNCPQGKDCNFPEPQERSATASDVKPFSAFAAQALREAMIQSGMSKEELAVFTDIELMQMYQEAVYNKTVGSESPEPADIDPKKLLYFEQLGPQEIRDLLVKAGVDPELIKTIPDGRLQEVYLQTLNDSVVDGE